MKEFEYKWEKDECIKPEGKWAVTDWKESTDTVLEIIDDLLKPHGLEIGLMEATGDFYEFSVIKTEKNISEKVKSVVNYTKIKARAKARRTYWLGTTNANNEIKDELEEK